MDVLLFDWFVFDQTSKIVDNKKGRPNKQEVSHTVILPLK